MTSHDIFFIYKYKIKNPVQLNLYNSKDYQIKNHFNGTSFLIFKLPTEYTYKSYKKQYVNKKNFFLSNKPYEKEPMEDLTGDRGVMKELLKEGKESTVNNSSSVKIHYEGCLDTGVVFDSSYKRNEPYVFIIGEEKVIKGWEIGVKSMKIGEKAKFEISSKYGYKKKGIPPIIPPNAKLFFEIELLDVLYMENQNANQIVNSEFMENTVVDIKKTSSEYKNINFRKNLSSFKDFFFISPFRSQNGLKIPWWLNPNITFLFVFLIMLILFWVVLLSGGIHQGYVFERLEEFN